MDNVKDLKILFNNEDLVAVHKPAGLLVHKTSIARDADQYALQLLRDQIGKRVYPVHRLDRKTHGVLVFALSSESCSHYSGLFAQRQTRKVYRAIVRGWIDERIHIDYPLKTGSKTQEAVTDGILISRFELPFAFGKFPTSRYSLVELYPKTGRYHQLRRHMAHIFHPIIGDRPHGCNKQNRLWKHTFNMTEMMLHAQSITFMEEPENITITSDPDLHFREALALLEPHTVPD